MKFKEVNQKQSFPKLEEEMLNFWNEQKIFEASVENREWNEEFNFYDGPPFATGTPHYGHILAGTIKDVIPRYQTMIWKKVERRFGWDTHGLPIENIVEKKLEIAWKEDLEERIWIFKFNEECRKNVFWYVDVWKKTVNRMWRWVDMENDYKTMDTPFMESVWWVFKELYDKWLIYEGYRVVPYSVWMATPLSNFEVNQWYQDKQDKTLTVKFKVKWNESKYILAWTTTPWTLVSNLWLAVWADLNYSEILDNKTWETYVLASDRIKDYYKQSKNETGLDGRPVSEEYKLIREYKGKCLEWIKYEPLYDDFVLWMEAWLMPKEIVLGKNAYSVVIGHHVTTESGTGIVHIAPAYWEDDYLIWKEQDLGFVFHINDAWKTCNLLSDNWVWVFDYNEQAIEHLKQRWVVLKISTINHSYPHCWRSWVPLIYRAISAWYVDVTAIKDKMISSNQNINWVPEEIKNGRMWKWLELAKDWNISRNRYWWSTIPVWQNEDKTEEVCIGSIKELYELNKDFWDIKRIQSPHLTSLKGRRIEQSQEKNVAKSLPLGETEWGHFKYIYTKTWEEVDLHKHFVDEIFIKNPKTWNTLKRIPEVLDCWFESGAMPYASKHFPFEWEKDFKFPADFIAEWLDQTRGWFYTLIILWVALYDVAPMKNVIVNGIVLAEDGQKMSKSKQNYPDPAIIFDKYWADAMRFYLMNSPVVEAQDFRFAEAWVEEVVKKVILPLWNTYSFFTTYANIDNFSPRPLGDKWRKEYLYDYSEVEEKQGSGVRALNNNLDKWLISELNELTKEVTIWFDSYKLNQAAKPIVKFMDNLTNWYIRRSRKRFWKTENDTDKLEAYETLYYTLVELSKIIAPFMPFVSDYIYKNLTLDKSVHLTDFPKYDENLIDLELNNDTEKVQKIITLGLAWRANNKIRVRQPLKSITITFELSDYYKDIIKEELNVKEVLVVEWTTLAKKICKPNGRTIGPKFGSNVKFIISEAKSWNFEELENWNVKVWDFVLEEWDFELAYEAWNTWETIEAWFGMVIAMDSQITPELKNEGYIRDIVRHIQESRKEADYKVDDRIQVSISGCDEVIKDFKEYIQSETLSTLVDDLSSFEINKDIEIEDIKVNLKLKK